MSFSEIFVTNIIFNKYQKKNIDKFKFISLIPRTQMLWVCVKIKTRKRKSLLLHLFSFQSNRQQKLVCSMASMLQQHAP